MHLSNNSAIAKHLTNQHSCPRYQYWKLLLDNTSFLEDTTNKQTSYARKALLIKSKKSNVNKINFNNGDNILKCI